MPDIRIAVGFAIPCPAMSGAEPWTASNTAPCSPIFAAGCEAEPADQTGAEVGDDVAVEIFQHQHVELLGPHHELHAAVVDDLVVRLDVGIILRDVVEAFEEQAVGELHYVRLVNGGDLFAAVGFGEFEAVSGDARRGFFGDDLDAFDHARDDDVLEAGVEVFGVLAHDDEVELRIAARHVRQGFDRPDVRVKVESFSQADVDGRETLCRSASSAGL